MEEIENPGDEKLTNLKSVDEILVDETIENRDQISTLQESKEEIESEMKKEIEENKELEEVKEKVKEVDQLKMKIEELEKQNLDENERFQLTFNSISQEKTALQDEVDLLKKSVDLLNGDLVREREVVSEMETIQEKLDLQVEESRDLKAKIKKLEKNELLIQKKLSEVETENEKLVKVKKTLESVKTENKAVEKKLAESLKAFDDLKQDKERIVLQKENIEKNRVYQLAKVDDLEKHVQELVATIASLDKNGEGLYLQKHVQELAATIASLEKNDEMLRNKVAEGDEAFQGLLSEKCLIEQKLVDLGKMVEELKQEKEEIIAEKSKIEKNMADQSVKVALENVKWRKGYTEALGKQQLLEVELDSQRKRVKEIVEEKDVIERTKMKKMEDELVALGMLESQLEKAYKDEMNANKRLKSKIWSLNDNLKRVAAEKSEIQKELELKKKEESSFSLKVVKLQNIIVDTVKEIERQRKEMKKLETRSEMLIQEKSLLEKKLVEFEKMESAQMNAEKALLMLKDAAQDQENEATIESVIGMMKIEEDSLPFAASELMGNIKEALKNKDKKMEEMTQQIEKLNKSAKRNSNIWAFVSSATTILAAAAATYIAKGR
ncbi:myosin heavy chain, fast skeletal muscle-like [Papaver somniferum]|uniref:myosin heavy chain, fast skeletal muscle-like n=1 Tax=Papaver somniferum TaxID=3469 RepID=UPI000E6FA77C|nr:myosin heavy chain, fast skeletal muscle-like [Papaver somniferum]